MRIAHEIDSMIKEDTTCSNSTLYEANNQKTIPLRCAQSVIQQPIQQSVIHNVSSISNKTSCQPTILTKGNVILVGKPSSVIHTPQQRCLQTLQVVVNTAGEKNTDTDHRHLSPTPLNITAINNDIMHHNAAHLKAEVLNTSGSADFFGKLESSGSDCDSNVDSEISTHSLSLSNSQYQSVSPSQYSSLQNLPTITMASLETTATGPVVRYTEQDHSEFFVPGEIVMIQNPGSDSSSNPTASEETGSKRAIRLMKNREAAKECRRKKKEYIKCLENRVAVLEAQNKALIDELKILKELYCTHKEEQEDHHEIEREIL